MPELPEVETARRTLRPVIGRRVADVLVLRPQAVRTHSAPALARALRGKRIRGLERRGKNLLIALDGLVLRFHFKLWGTVRLHPHPLVGDKETAAVVSFTDGSVLEFRELQLSELGLHRAAEVTRIPAVAGLGPDPFAPSFTRTPFERQLRGARGAVKNVLTDQRRFAGIGNLWAHEVLHRARIAPSRPLGFAAPSGAAGSLQRDEGGAARGGAPGRRARVRGRGRSAGQIPPGRLWARRAALPARRRARAPGTPGWPAVFLVRHLSALMIRAFLLCT